MFLYKCTPFNYLGGMSLRSTRPMANVIDGAAAGPAMVQIKSKFELEFRRISVPRSEANRLSLDAFYRLITDAHCLPRAAPVQISYKNSQSERLIRLESSEQLATALRSASPLLKVFVSRLRGVEVEVSVLQYLDCQLPTRPNFISRSLEVRKKNLMALVQVTKRGVRKMVEPEGGPVEVGEEVQAEELEGGGGGGGGEADRTTLIWEQTQTEYLWPSAMVTT